MMLKIRRNNVRKVTTIKISSIMLKGFYSGSVRWIPIILVFVLRLVCFSLLAIGFTECANSSDISLNNTGVHGPLKRDPKLIEIHKRLRALNKPAVKSIQSPDGDIIDCVLRHKQLAFDHPLLKNHTIQTFSRSPHGVRSSSRANRTLRHPFQVWHLNGMRCPEETIPVRRITVEDLMRDESLELHSRGFHRGSRKYRTPNVLPIEHKHVGAFVENGQYYGGQATINSWRPMVEVPEEYSLSEMLLVAGSSYNGDLNTIEVGWQVFPGLYADNRPRLFTYWTKDSYRHTGCYNTRCPGFVQTNTDIEMGGAIYPTSEYEGRQYEMTYFVSKDRESGNWVLRVEENDVGYWPADIFTHLAQSAVGVQWRGEILNVNPHGRHTLTQMGSGHLPEEGHGRAAYFRDLKTVDENRELRNARLVGVGVDDEEFYQIEVSYDQRWGEYFYYGGPEFRPGSN